MPDQQKHTPVISVRDVSLTYTMMSRLFFSRRKYDVLKGISFDLNTGDSLGIIGRNGAGKSSLLRLLARVIDPDKGEVINHGVKASLMALQVGFENELSGRENILLTGLMLGFDRAFIESRKDRIVEFSELGDFLDVPVKTYSSGMRARLSFAIGYSLESEVLLIDEVLGVGDVEFRKKSSAAMREKIRSDQTVVLVSHDANTIKSLCNRALWIEDGQIRMDGPADSVVEAYQDFVTQNPLHKSIAG